MTSVSKRILILFAGFATVAACASGLTLVVEYKPWGVPDSRRQDYEAIVAKLDQRDALQEYYRNRARPVAKPTRLSHHAGLQPPNSEGSQRFEVLNEGLESLELQLGSVDASCTVSFETPSFETVRIAPGQSGFVIVSWINGDTEEDFEHAVTIKTNDPLNEDLQFKIAGSIRKKLVVPDSATFRAADPAVQTDGSFVISSQVWNEFEISHAECDLPLFQWYAEPIEHDDPELQGTSSTSAWRVMIWTTVMEFGHFDGNLNLTIRADDGTSRDCDIALHGRVRPPIIFHSPEIHMADGLDVGTVFSGKEHQFHLLVRLRGDRDRPIEVLDVQPEQLRAELTPQTIPGNYRLTVTIPADCPMVVFNTREQHGYVSVGDPNDKQFKNWFPIHGAVVPSQR